MYRVDNSTAVTTKPTRSAVGPKPNSYYGDPTVVEGDHMNVIMDEICNTVEESGLALDKESGAAPAADDQLYQAIERFLKGTSTNIINPFMNYALLQERVTSDVSSVTGWNDRDLVSVVNRIDGLSDSAGEITLPAGTYRISGYGCFVDEGTGISSGKLAIYNISDTSYQIGGVYIFGSTAIGRDADGDKSLIYDEFTISAPTLIKLRQYNQENDPKGLGSHLAIGETGDYTVASQLEIWKLD